MPDPVSRLRALGFSEGDAHTLAGHFVWADKHGLTGHGVGRIYWLEGFDMLEPAARPERVEQAAGYERWNGSGALGYLTLAAVVDAQLAEPPDAARVVVCSRTFPTGALGYRARLLARGGLVAALTATSPRRLPSPAGGPPLTGTNPLAIAVPLSDGRPLAVDASMGAVTHGDVLAGTARLEELVPLGWWRPLPQGLLI